MLEKWTRAAAKWAERARGAAEPVAPTPDEPFPAGAHPLDLRRSGLGNVGKKIAASVAEALLADEDDQGRIVAADAATVRRVVHKLDLWLGTGSLQLQNGFLGLCLAMQTAPLLVLRRPTPFTRLSIADRVHVLEALEEHENGLFTMLLTAFKVPLATAAFEDGPLLLETGFDRVSLRARRTLTKPAGTPP